jgi:hypothetical protein
MNNFPSIDFSKPLINLFTNIEKLDNLCIKNIFSHLDPVELKVISLFSEKFKQIIPEINNKKYFTANELLRYSVRLEDPFLCQIARCFGAQNVDQMLIMAASLGNIRLCEMARIWGATNFDDMFTAAFRNKWALVCRLAIDWGAFTPLTYEKKKDEFWDHKDTNLLLLYGARTNNVNLCFMAIKEGADDTNGMLIEAAKCGSTYLCRLARRIGANNVNTMLCIGAEHGHERICQLAKEWGATDFQRMRSNADFNGYWDLEALARSWM